MGRERAEIIIKGVLILAVAGFLFYNSPLSILIGSPFLIFYYRYEQKKRQKKRAEELTLHFKEALLSVLAALKAGYSVENAFVEAYRDLEYRFGSADEMAKELLFINRQVKNNVPIERLLEDFAKKSGNDDIRDFAQVFAIAKRSGGDMGRVLERTVSMLTRKMETQENIRMLVASKRYEQQIMNVVPMGIIFYIRLTNPGYFDVLYHNPAGIAVMTAALAVYLAAYRLSEKILEIA